MKPDPPPGYVAWRDPSPFVEHVGPLFEGSSDSDGRSSFGFRVLPHHSNRSGHIHGGLLLTVADAVLGAACERAAPPDTDAITLHVHFDFMASASVGDWVDVIVSNAQMQNQIWFASSSFYLGETLIGRGTGRFLTQASDRWK